MGKSTKDAAMELDNESAANFENNYKNLSGKNMVREITPMLPQ